MILRLILAGAIVLSASIAALGQQARPSYAGEEKRSIKALSAGEVEALLNGQGMGLAKAAELNHYPGPKHVLELTKELQLTEDQRVATGQVFDRMQREAIKLGKLIIEEEKKLDALFAGGKADSRKLRVAVARIAQLQGKLRAAHLRAHLEMRRLLSPSQIAKYDELRGYSGGGEHKHGSGQH